MNALRHFGTITKHKLLVMKACFQVGLYRQGLLHDLSKYGWTEFRVGCRYYQGTRSPNNAEREEKGYSSAWLHHKGRNKHHYEYWIDYGTHGAVLEGSPASLFFINLQRTLPQKAFGWLVGRAVYIEKTFTSVCLSCFKTSQFFSYHQKDE